MRAEIYYSLMEWKNKKIYKLILWLYKRTDRFLFQSIKYQNQKWYSGRQIFIIENSPCSVGQTEYILNYKYANPQET